MPHPRPRWPKRPSSPRGRRRPRRFIIAGLVIAAALFATYRTLPHLFPQLLGPLGTTAATSKRDVPPALADLPAVFYDGHDKTGPVAILLSGNGGWWGLCDQLAKRLREHHVSTIGLNSLAYFVSYRTPKDIARDLQRMASTFDAHRPIMLIGFSYGADVAATIYDELDPALRARIQLVSLMGLTRDVKYGIGFWQLTSPRHRTAPAVAKISGPAVFRRHRRRPQVGVPRVGSAEGRSHRAAGRSSLRP